MNYLFINCSKNKNGVTSELGKTVLKGMKSDKLHLADYSIKQIDQEHDKRTDQFKEVFAQFKEADVILIGTPVYWSSMTGYLKTFIDRFTDVIDENVEGKEVYLIVQGTAPEDAIPFIEHVIKHVCHRFNMKYKGFVQNKEAAKRLNKIL
ncbi:flavodoxin family protein [Oceanobacillus picturae]|uniref:flavodoxin family protein n=1 Tax=Oceanobacillus picturae TaxID=171693 RepID=UPI00363DD669